MADAAEVDTTHCSFPRVDPGETRGGAATDGRPCRVARDPAGRPELGAAFTPPSSSLGVKDDWKGSGEVPGAEVPKPPPAPVPRLPSSRKAAAQLGRAGGCAPSMARRSAGGGGEEPCGARSASMGPDKCLARIEVAILDGDRGGRRVRSGRRSGGGGGCGRGQ